MSVRHIWLRAETKEGEKRCPLTPAQTKALIEAGYHLSVERSATRAFANDAFEAAGCRMVLEGSWPEAPNDAVILGLKELPEESFPLIHTHLYFAHCFKEQAGWQALMSRFAAGEGRVLDLEFLVDADGRRVAAFGYWAGFAGAAVAMDLICHRQHSGVDAAFGPLSPYAGREAWISELRAKMDRMGRPDLRAIVIGALGRCGRGALELVRALDCEVTAWDMAETAVGGPFDEILDHDVFINCVYLGGAIPPFLTPDMLDRTRRLAVICDVSCDPQSPYNPIPIYSDTSSFREPSLRVRGGDLPVDVIAIDHLPGLLPREASESFAQDLFDHIACLNTGSPVWERAAAKYRKVLAQLA